MAELEWRYLFPFEKVPHGSRILIYGAGTLGRAYLQQMEQTKYAEVVAVIDRAADKCPHLVVPILPPEKIPNLCFTYVVVALRGKVGYKEIERKLLVFGVEKANIVFVGEREPVEIESDARYNKGDIKQGKAFQCSNIAIAFRLTGGLGDFLIQKRLMLEIFRLLPNAKVDIYTRGSIDFISLIYRDCSSVNGIYADFDEKYAKLKLEYALAMSVVGSGYVKVDFFVKNAFNEQPDFVERIKRLKLLTESENVGFNVPSALMFWQRIYKGQNAYTGFCYDGIFPICDKRVFVMEEPEDISNFNKLKLGKYITMNFGNGESQTSFNIAKTWPRERFELLVALIKQKYDIQIIQIGVKNADIIKGTDRQFFGARFGLVAQILKYSILHIDIEGGMTHLASQLGTKCAVLFGPTPMEYYAYDNNINIQAGNCHNCYGLYQEVNKCARGMKEPECMYSITPEIVMSSIKSYMYMKIKEFKR